MPWRDWQFWIVSALALWGGWVLLRPLLPRRKSSDAGCPHCASGAAATKPKRRVALTVERKRV